MSREKHLLGRQNVLPANETEARLEAVATTFGYEWLSEGEHPLQLLWARKDALATNQLAWYGDALIQMQSINATWVRRELSSLKSSDPNTRKGATFELLALSAFSPHHRVMPATKNNPGYDGTIGFRDGGTASLSLKSYGASVHELDVRVRGEKLERTFLNAIRDLKRNGVEARVLAAAFPLEADWKRLESNLPAIIASDPGIPGQVCVDGIWTIHLRALDDFDRRTSHVLSHQFMLLIPHHANERNNLISKLERAYSNAERHAGQNRDDCHAVMIHLPESASMTACEHWIRDYYGDDAQTPIDLVIFYQPAVAVLPDGLSAIIHVTRHHPSPAYRKWVAENSRDRRLIMRAFVGVNSSDPARLVFRTGDGKESSADWCYHFQTGHHYSLVDFNVDGVVEGKLTNPAPGLVRHALLPNGLELKGIFPPTSELIIFG